MNLYFQINILLLITSVILVCSQKTMRLLDVKSSSKNLLRISQTLFVISLILPVLMKTIPHSQLPGLETSTFQSYSDVVSLNSSITKAKDQTLRAVQTTTREIENVSEGINLRNVFFVLLIIGFVVFLARFFKNYLNIRKVLVESIVLRQNARMKIVVSSHVLVPFSVRLLKGYWVVLPENILTHKLDLRLAIKHELQHHRQGDTSWSMGMEFISCFFFFNPAIYLWKNIITEFQEFSCDEALSGQKDVSSHDYGSCLLRVAETALNHRQMYVGTTSMAAIIRDSNYFKKFLLRRIEMITEKKRSKRTWIASFISLIAIMSSVAFAVGAEKLMRDGTSEINPGKITVDKDVQKIADDVLTRAIARTKATAGFVIVADPVSGKILAVANMDLKGKRKGHWVLNELMETASIAKPLVVAEAFERNKTTPASNHKCENGEYNFNGTVYRDWKTNGWETLTTSEALEVSSNICAIKIAKLIGEDGLTTMLEKFGFGENGSASKFPEARIGEMPVPGPQLIPQVTSGFGFKSSPLEVLQAYGAIANGGELMGPITNKEEGGHPLRRVLSKANSEKMRTLLQNVVLKGTGKRAQSDLYTTAGKTASSLLNNFMEIEWYGTKQVANYAGFIGFAPVKNPKVEVFVGLINPNTDGSGAHGGEHAAPVFKEVVENVLTHLKVSPDRI